MGLRFLRAFASHIAEVGTAAAVCIALYAAIAFGVEFGMPGTAAGVVAPQHVAVALAAAVALALVGPVRERRSWPGRAFLLTVAALSGIAAYAAASRAFAPVPELRQLLAPSFAVTVWAVFAGAAWPRK